jgi:hypothetical protein
MRGKLHELVAARQQKQAVFLLARCTPRCFLTSTVASAGSPRCLVASSGTHSCLRAGWRVSEVGDSNQEVVGGALVRAYTAGVRPPSLPEPPRTPPPRRRRPRSAPWSAAPVTAAQTATAGSCIIRRRRCSWARERVKQLQRAAVASIASAAPLTHSVNTSRRSINSRLSSAHNAPLRQVHAVQRGAGVLQPAARKLVGGSTAYPRRVLLQPVQLLRASERCGGGKRLKRR